MKHGLLLLVAWISLTGATTPLPLVAPPPDLTKLVPFVSAPLAKPPVTIAIVRRPRPPLDVDPVPPARVSLPAADRPVAPVPSPRALPCAAAWLPIASEALECGRARFLKGEYEEAARAFESAASRSSERELTREARYWLGESFVRLGRPDQANPLFRQIMQEAPRVEHGLWAAHASGWVELASGNAERARLVFTPLVGVSDPVLDSWVRHGLGLSLYALARYVEAEQTWAALRARSVPAALARDVLFWHGETLGRLGQYARAETELGRFVQGGAHPLLESGILRRGWWGLAAGHHADSVTAFRAYLAAPGRAATSGRSDAATSPRVTERSERDWAEAGLALALLAAGDGPGAQAAATNLEARRSPLLLPVLLRVVASALDRSRAADAQALIERMLGGSITTPARAWLLFAKGEAYAAEGNRDEARTQYELARDAEPGSETGLIAAYRAAQMNVELREFAQAATDLGVLLAASLGDDVRAATLLLQGEAAYQAGDAGAAAASYRRFLSEFPNHAETPSVRLALAWTALRQQQSEEALRQFTEFAGAHPGHPHAVDALELASELSLAAGDLERARKILEQIVGTYGDNPRSQFARLNLAILPLRAGQVNPGALPALRGWIARAPFPPLLGRAHVALGAALLAVGQAEASNEFKRAEAEGVGALAVLGLASAAFAQQRWDEAGRGFTEARNTGTPDIAAAADYGLAALKLRTGSVQEFKPLARAVLDQAPNGPSAPVLLYVLTGIAVEEKDWPAALATARQLVTQFPSHPAADDGLERVGAGAASAQAWPVAYEAYALLREKYPSSPFVKESATAFAEAQLQTGHAREAREAMEQAATAEPSDVRAWLALARAREATGDRQGALDAYANVTRQGRGPELDQALLGQARLMAVDQRGEQARGPLQRLLLSDDKSVVVEAASALGETYQREGDHLAAIEYYMTAAYLDPGSSAGRRALVAAGQSFAALKQRDAAAVVYGKLLAQPDVPADLAAAARQGLAAIGR